MYYQQQPFYPVPSGATPTREEQLRLYEEQKMREKEEIKRRENEERKRRDYELFYLSLFLLRCQLMEHQKATVLLYS